ncbi:hypothetical protein, partial [Alistipes inops]|uniref:hypothetical protein n=1 Tax=Alistipes inops TaxID=1501391 RepID=UPI00214CBCF5
KYFSAFCQYPPNFSQSGIVLSNYTHPPNTQALYFIPVLIYTPNKVKSKQREEKKWLRQTSQPRFIKIQK